MRNAIRRNRQTRNILHPSPPKKVKVAIIEFELKSGHFSSPVYSPSETTRKLSPAIPSLLFCFESILLLVTEITIKIFVHKFTIHSRWNGLSFLHKLLAQIAKPHFWKHSSWIAFLRSAKRRRSECTINDAHGVFLQICAKCNWKLT